ncbi:MAG: EF-P lysine aminoacylase GenX [Alphaproteobacteria bacterium]|nr:EF-P lysine aminoacylase GenX [Alphaproteobacteria bacterium]
MSARDPPPAWTPARHALRRPALGVRNALTRAIREHFEAEGFTEVETASLGVSPGNEAHLHGVPARLTAPDGAARDLYLRTSPEFACKTLLAAGETRIFELARVWRDRERGPLHAPEFTMLEWYRAHEPYERLMDDCTALLGLAARVGGRDVFSFRGRTAQALAAPRRLTVAQAFADLAGVDLLASLSPDGTGDRETLAAAAREAGVRVAEDDLWSDIFSKVLVERIEPHLGLGAATVLCEYPACEAALARLKPGDPRVAERFELYVCGVELANAFGELTDAVEQRRRFEIEMAEKRRVYGHSYPLDESLLSALEIMPPACGAALGLDRLAMLAAGVERVEQVQWTPTPQGG